MHFLFFVFSAYVFNVSVVLQNFAEFGIKNVSLLLTNIYYKNAKLFRGYFLPKIFFLFITIFISNIMGMVPFSYAVTSSIIFNFYVAAVIFFVINFIGVTYHKYNFFNIFMPKGLPLTFTWFLIFFEMVSYFARIFSLTIRLFANILAGHILQHILIWFAFKLIFAKSFFAYIFFMPWIITFLVSCLELSICFLQAYVLFVLLFIYWGNVLYLH